MSEPRTYMVASWLFLRLLGISYLIAFVSLARQIRGLAGAKGILPAAEVLASKDRGRISRFWRCPTLCWLDCSDEFLLVLSWGGAGLALLLTAGLAPMPILILLWMAYLSLFNVCRFFLGYQWDVLLLETGFLAIFLAPLTAWSRIGTDPAPLPIIVWLFWWLLFRLMFSSGFVKLRSGDRAWRNLTALHYHYETQPLPTPLAWYAHRLPLWFHKVSTGVVLAVELVGPILMLGPAPARYAACGSFIGLMLLIELTGNYAFFNLLGVALSLLLLDDAFWSAALPQWGVRESGATYRATGVTVLDAVIGLLALVLLFLSCDVMAKLFRKPLAWPGPLLKVLEWLIPFHLVNGYGLFAVITLERPEIIVEGSDDGETWHAYEFRWKPGPVNEPPRFVAPHQPRLDWQMWFAALGYCENNPWFVRFLTRLLEGSPPVLQLLKRNPFPQKPPRYVRGIVCDYRFTDRPDRRSGKAWWRAEFRGIYCPVLELADVPEGVPRRRQA